LFAAAMPASVSNNPVSYAQELVSETPTEYCADVTVTNNSDQAVEWEVTLDISAAPYNAASIASSWNVSTVAFAPGAWRVKGVEFNSVLAAGASYAWGYCATRTPPALTDATAV